MEIHELDRRIRECRACAAHLSKHPVNPGADHRPVEPRPVLSPPIKAPIMLVGQAPGIDEYLTGRPFSGGAGQAIRHLFVGCGLRRNLFDTVVYQTSAVKCFPGRKLDRGRSVDRQPDAAMKDGCRPFLRRQIEEVDPTLIVSMGSVALDALDRLRGRTAKRTMTDALGRAEEWGERVIIIITHTSGSNRLLNDPKNERNQQKGLDRLRSAIAAMGLQS